MGFIEYVEPRKRVDNAPGKPVMLYDRDCRFCVLWIGRWKQITGEAVEYVALQDDSVRERFPEVPRERLEVAVHFIDGDGAIYSGAEAVFRALAENSSLQWPLKLYQRFPLVAGTTERSYRFVAGHRTLFSWLTRALWGKHVERPEQFLVRRVFLVWIGAVYFFAFTSLWTQIGGLMGKDGILPAADLMQQASSALGANGIGIDRYRLLPTLCWFDVSDSFLRFQCVAGTVLALLAMAGFGQWICFALMWVLYLSLTTVGGDFFAFQWDMLLLETGLLAIFFSPMQVIPRRSGERPPSRIVLWLLRLLLFKLTFLSGVVKLASGDETWRNLTALMFHYETQPLPTWTAWMAHQLPVWVQKVSCLGMFGIELVAPFLIFAPRRPRMIGGAFLAILQVSILLTGNYTFFNWLTLGLCLLVLDDFALAKFLPRRLPKLYSATVEKSRPDFIWRWRLVALVPFAAIITCISVMQIISPFARGMTWMSPVVTVYRWVAPSRSVNSYGLFAVMTRERPEIIVEGSDDGRDWKAYEFLYKPGDVNRRPGFVAPHQPRLDWQMWFAALGGYRQNPWFVNLCIRLLEGSGPVLGLLKENPFPEKPPRFVRAQVYDYHFTSMAERKKTGAWWKREFRGEYLRPISLDMVRGTTRQPGAGE